MIKIDYDKCINCLECVKECSLKELRYEDKSVKCRNKYCISCGHCFAICPVNAIEMTSAELDPYEKIIENNNFPGILPEEYLNYLKLRRSIRRFNEKSISEEKLEKILEAVRYSPTGSNRQDVRITIIKNDMEKFKEQVYSELYSYSEAIDKNPNATKRERGFSYVWKKLYSGYFSDERKDGLFYNAPLIMIFSAELDIDAAIASVHAETMAYALELGALYSGFTIRALNYSNQLKKYISLDKNIHPVACLLLGNTDVKYFRSVHRNKINVDVM